MTIEEIKLYALRQRIKAYIYWGTEAEMDMIASEVEKSFLDPDEEKNIHEAEWYEKQRAIFEAKIKRCNQRIDDLTVVVGVEHA